MKKVVNVLVSVSMIPLGIFTALVFSLLIWFVAFRFGLTEATKLLIRKAKR